MCTETHLWEMHATTTATTPLSVPQLRKTSHYQLKDVSTVYAYGLYTVKSGNKSVVN